MSTGPKRAVRVKTSTGWVDLAIEGAPGVPGYPATTGKLNQVLTVTTDGAAPTWKAAGGGGTAFRYNVSQAASPGTPTAGQCIMNGADIWSVTQIKVHRNDSDGVDRSALWRVFDTFGFLIIEQAAGQYLISQLTATPTYASSVYTFTVVYWGEGLTTPVPPNLMTVGFVNNAFDIDYKGDRTGSFYYVGDIVVYNGVAYICVVPQTNAAPVAWPGGPGSVATYPTPTYGTTFPASPFDGQQHILVDSVTAPNYSWLFRYNAQNTTAYKWEFIGGAPRVIGGGNFTTATGPTGWVDGNGPSFNAPRAGVYTFSWGTSYTTESVDNTGSAMMGITGPGMPVPVQFYFNSNRPTPTTMTYAGTITSAGIMKCQFQSNVAMTATFVTPWMSVLPIQVS